MKVPEKGKGGDFIPCPAGTHNAVCVDVIRLTDVARAFGDKSWTETQYKFVFQVEKAMPDGKRFIVQTFGMKESMHEKAKLRAFLEAFAGRKFEVGEDVDPDAFYGKPCFLTVVHKKGGQDGTLIYANLGGIAPPMEIDGALVRPAISPDANYVRVKDRPAEGVSEEAPDHDDSDVPF